MGQKTGKRLTVHSRQLKDQEQRKRLNAEARMEAQRTQKKQETGCLRGFG
jgi:hypothetical protein